MIAIAGAGIGGLTLGRALARHGIPFRIFERAPALRPAGAGIALADNALRALSHIGLATSIRDVALPLRRADICEPSGRVLTRTGELPFDVVVMPRTVLQHALRQTIEPQVECSRPVAGFTQEARGVRIRFEDGTEAAADALIGADGLHSQVRRTLRGEEPVRYSGQTSWRAIASLDLPDHQRMTETWGPGRRFGIVPMRDQQVYWFAAADAPPGGADSADVGAVLRRQFAGWHAPIEAILAATPAARILRTDICDRMPIPRWSEGRVALIGDAAHPMTPNLGMGGCQAIEDAVVLAEALRGCASVEAAFARYETARVARANGFVNRSFTIGRVAHARSAPVRWLRNRALAAIPRSLALRAIRRDLDFRL